MCTILANYCKTQHVYYKVNSDKNALGHFMNYVKEIVEQKFLIHDEVFILDNAAIHVGKESKELVDYLWNTKVNGKPLNILVLFLPTRAPELNPIELIFNILVIRLKSYHYRNNTGVRESVIARAGQIMDSIPYETILRTCQHCRYLQNDVSNDDNNNN